MHAVVHPLGSLSLSRPPGREGGLNPSYGVAVGNAESAPPSGHRLLACLLWTALTRRRWMPSPHS